MAAPRPSDRVAPAPPGHHIGDRIAGHARRIIWAAVALGLLLRLVFALGYWVHRPLTHDEREYLLLADNLAAGRGFTYDTLAEGGADGEHFGRVPIYPLFISVVRRVAGRLDAPGGADAPSLDAADASAAGTQIRETPRSLKIAQSLVGAGGVWLLGALAMRAAGPVAGAVASMLGAVYPPLIWICAYTLSEGLYSVLALGSALLLDLGVSQARSRPETGPDEVSRRSRPVFAGAPTVVVSGLVAGLATLTRPAMLFFLLFAGLWLLKRRSLLLAVALAVGATVVIAPWTIRNAREHGRIVLVSSQGGITFWTGNNPLARGEGDMAANPEIKRANLALRQRFPGRTPEELEPIYYREAFAYIAEDPGRWVTLVARKFFYLWVPIGPSYTLHSRVYFAASLLSYGLLLPAALVGFVRLRHRRAPLWPLWLLAASAVFVCLVFFPQERFRLPVIDPTLIVCAAAWPASVWSPTTARDSSSSPW